MHKASMGITPEGFPTIGLGVVCTMAFGLVGFKYVALASLLFTAFSIHFFRDPERVPPSGAGREGLVISPADGRVVSVGRTSDPLTGEMKMRVCVFMNVFNVHVNRSPVSATVEEIKYIPGKYINASLDKASEDNERCLMGLRDENGERWTVVQIAGLIARRIVCRAQEGDSLELGQRFGLIKFGSRVDLYMPSDYEVLLRKGDKVIAGSSVVARKVGSAS